MIERVKTGIRQRQSSAGLFYERTFNKKVYAWAFSAGVGNGLGASCS